MPIPGYQQWMNDTALGMIKPRSTLLKTLDAAIQQYDLQKNQQNLFKIKNAFEDWKRSKGGSGENSERNGKGAITRLESALSTADYRTFQITKFSMEELLALQYMNTERKRVITNVFQGKEVNLKAARLKETVKNTAQTASDAAGKAATYMRSIGKTKTTTTTSSSGGKPTSEVFREKFEGMVKSMFSVTGLEQLGSLSGVVLDILAKAAVSVPPVVGHIKDGYDLFTGWAKVGSSLYDQIGVANRSYVIETGAPAAAFTALHSLLVDETRNQTIAATQATTSFALKTGLAFVDGGAISGPVVGAVNALATLAQQISLLAIEYRSTKAINEALSAGQLDIRLFRTYPLMGCYLMISGTLSDLIPIDCFGTPGWMTYIEGSKHEFDRIYNSATKLVDASPWEIQGLPKRKTGTGASIFGEAGRAAGLGGSVGGLAGLAGIKKPS